VVKRIDLKRKQEESRSQQEERLIEPQSKKTTYEKSSTTNVTIFWPTIPSSNKPKIQPKQAPIINLNKRIEKKNKHTHESPSPYCVRDDDSNAEYISNPT
jgi:hypothetical protein